RSQPNSVPLSRIAVRIDLRSALGGEPPEVDPRVVLVYGREPVLGSGRELGVAAIAANRAQFPRPDQPPVAGAFAESVFQHRILLRVRHYRGRPSGVA